MKRIWIHLLTLVMLLSACGIKEPSSANVIDGKSNAIEVIEGLSVEVLSNLETPTLIFYDSTVRPELTIYAINHISEQTAKKT